MDVNEGSAGKVIRDILLTRRDVLKGAAVLGAATAFGPTLAACGNGTASSATSTSSSSAAGQPKTGGNLRIAVLGGSDAQKLDPQNANLEAECVVNFSVYDTLLGWDPHYKIIPGLAESVEPNSDGSVWTAKLRQGVKFHDGTPFTADAVAYSYARIINPKDPKAGAPTLASLKASGIRKVDDYTVEFHLDPPNVVFDEALAEFRGCILPPNWNEQTQIGTGPWIVKKFVKGQRWEYAANKDYWGEGPYADTLTVIEFADAAARVNALLGGTVDAMTQLPTAQVQTVQSSGQKVLDAKTGSWFPMTMRIDVKPFSDPKVRQAFRLIPDRQAMINQAYAGYGWVANDMYSPFDLGYAKDLPQRAQDLEQAKSLLKAAGYDNNLTVTLTTSDGVGAGCVEAAQVYAEQAAGAGVKVNVNKVPSSVMFGPQFLKWPFAQDFWFTHNYLQTVLLLNYPTAPYNETHWKNDQWLALVNKALSTTDDAKRNDLVSQAMTIEHDEGGLIVWAFNNQVDAYSPKLGGVIPDQRGLSLSSLHFNRFYFV